MAAVNIRINGRDYKVACDDGQEEHLRLLADDIDDRLRSLVFRMGSNPGEGTALLLTALTMADEILESKKENERLSAQLADVGSQLDDEYRLMQETRIVEMESAMAETLEGIAQRIEKIAERIEIQ